MKLSLKQKALAQTIGMFALAGVAAVVITFIIANVSTAVLVNAIGVGSVVGSFAWLAYIFYSITLSRLEFNEKLKDLNKKD
jgi:hypothetical protein